MAFVWLINGGGPNYLLTGMILQVAIAYEMGIQITTRGHKVTHRSHLMQMYGNLEGVCLRISCIVGVGVILMTPSQTIVNYIIYSLGTNKKSTIISYYNLGPCKKTLVHSGFHEGLSRPLQK